LAAVLAWAGCARSGATPTRAPSADAPSAPQADAEDPAVLLRDAQAALDAEQGPRAVALFGRYLAVAPDAPQAASAYLGLAAAHELSRDCAAAVLAYDAYLEGFAEGEQRTAAFAGKGACEAELERWTASAASFRQVHTAPDQLPSTRIEGMAREGFALFMLERDAEAAEILAEADAVYERAMETDAERFATFYFVGMARFYRAAILHREFRKVKIELPERVMAKTFKRKLQLLDEAQDAYNHAIKARHMYWVSAAGFQLGHLMGEFYDDVMYAPVPDWLDERQRGIYYVELKKQLRPVIDKAAWVFEKNLETARRLGYESKFTELTEAKLGHLRAVLLSDEATLGKPHERLAPHEREAVGPAPGSAPVGELPAAERKLFVPEPTWL
jgi:hypothetical protein